MSRSQQRRIPTERELAYAQLIAEALWRHREVGLGDAQIARQVGLSWAVRVRRRTRRVIQDVMPFVVMEIANTHPGFTVDRPGGGLAMIISDPNRARSIGTARIFKCDTALRRASAELQVLANTPEVNDRKLARRAEMLVDALDDMARILDQQLQERKAIDLEPGRMAVE